MALSDLFKVFTLTAIRANGGWISGAQVRILNASNNDVTSSFFGSGVAVEPTTDAQGQLNKLFLTADALPAGVYTIQVIAPGFTTWSFTTPNTFIGAGSFTANLERPSVLSGYTVTPPADAPLSAMTPIVCTVESPNLFDWEYIRCTVENADGSSSVIEAPVDKATGLATLDIRNRVKLGIRPLLVGDGQSARIDTDFSGVVSVSFSSLSGEGETPLDVRDAEGFTRLVAQSLPFDGQTNLSPFVASNVRKWLVPPGPVFAFKGYYRDVSCWIPQTPTTGYTVLTRFYGAADNLLSELSTNMVQSQRVQRVRLLTDVSDNVAKCTLTIKDGNNAISETLTVLYRD